MKLVRLSKNPQYQKIPYNYLKEHRWNQVDLDWLFSNVFTKVSIPEFFLAIEKWEVCWFVLINFCDFEWCNKPWIWSLYVFENFRNLWIWANLVRKVENYVKKLWFSRIWLDTYQAWKYYERKELDYTYYKDSPRIENKYVRVYYKDLY